ncbi:MAG TPA: SH3 domain-containing protein [Burkholderiaceae bacterium]|nr:SH3 domain-containing protein [Burkholderiaceae bacterium]
MNLVRLLFAPITAVALSLAANAAQALEFKAVGANPAIMYDAPSKRGRKVFIAPRGMPVEVVLTYGDWSKVRDVAGDLLWVESKALNGKRAVVVKTMNAKIRVAAEDNAPVAFSADRSVLLELAGPAASGWIKVRHRDGQIGFVKAMDVWGE